MRVLAQHFFNYTSWPLLLGAIFAVYWLFFQVIPSENIAFSVVYLLTIGVLYLAEYRLPQVPEWLKDDGQSLNDVLLTLVSKTFSYAFLQINLVLFAVDTFSDTAMASKVVGWGLWPHSWPFWVQLIGVAVLCEFFLYWYHRLAHEFKPLWCFHAVHHFPKRLWVVNTGRSHVVDSTLFMVGIVPAIVLGVHPDVLATFMVMTAFIGLLSHTNLAVPMGPWRYIFNGADNHRWHHSIKMSEGNRNYGQNLMLWDHIFGTYYQDVQRKAPKRLGSSLKLPKDFVGQLREPVRAFVKSLRQPLWYK